MKYKLGFLNLNFIDSINVKLSDNSLLGCKAEKMYNVSLKEKNWLEKKTSSKGVKDIPNIILKSNWRTMKIIITNTNREFYEFSIVTSFLIFGSSRKINFINKGELRKILGEIG